MARVEYTAKYIFFIHIQLRSNTLYYILVITRYAQGEFSSAVIILSKTTILFTYLYLIISYLLIILYNINVYLVKIHVYI